LACRYGAIGQFSLILLDTTTQVGYYSGIQIPNKRRASFMSVPGPDGRPGEKRRRRCTVGDCAGLIAGRVEAAGMAGGAEAAVEAGLAMETGPAVAGRGGEARYFPGIPEGFPNAGDLRVARALAKMSWMLHRWAPPSSLWPGHEERIDDHRRRVRKRMARSQRKSPEL
jgi:hypothetical protein